MGFFQAHFLIGVQRWFAHFSGGYAPQLDDNGSVHFFMGPGDFLLCGLGPA